MQENKKNRYMTVFLLLGICTAVFVILNICIGSVRITLPDMIKIFAGSGDDETLKKILVDIRFPRAVAVLILGGALSLAGYLLQTFFNNPIAGPFVLGISSGKIGQGDIRNYDFWGIYRRYAFHGICTFALKQGQQYVNAGGKRRYDWLYLFCNNGIGCHFCR